MCINIHFKLYMTLFYMIPGVKVGLHTDITVEPREWLLSKNTSCLLLVYLPLQCKILLFMLLACGIVSICFSCSYFCLEFFE